MFDLSTFFVSQALAADPVVAPASTLVASGNAFMQFVPLFLIFGVFYFLLIRPQQKKLDAQTAMLKALKKGDRVLTAGGILGTLYKIDSEETLTVEIADGVRVKVARSTIGSLITDETSKAEAKKD